MNTRRGGSNQTTTNDQEKQQETGIENGKSTRTRENDQRSEVKTTQNKSILPGNEPLLYGVIYLLGRGEGEKEGAEAGAREESGGGKTRPSNNKLLYTMADNGDQSHRR